MPALLVPASAERGSIRLPGSAPLTCTTRRRFHTARRVPGVTPRADKESRLWSAAVSTAALVWRGMMARRSVSYRRRDDGWVARGSPYRGKCPGVNSRAEKAKPTEGAGESSPREVPDRLTTGVGKRSPFSGLLFFSPAALARVTHLNGGDRFT